MCCETDKAAFLDLLAVRSDGVWSVNEDGTFGDDHTYWTGFREGTADGLRYEVLAAAAPSPVPLPASAWLLALAVGGLGAMRGRRARTA